MIRIQLGITLAILSGFAADAYPAPTGATLVEDPDVNMAAFVSDTKNYFERLENLGFAGAVLVSQGENTLLHAGYGMADREQSRPWTTMTVSTIGSITKQFTAAAILLLQEDGKLSVGDSITTYFPNVPEDKQSITLHQLLTHSSGIVDLAGLGDWDPIDRDTFVQRAMAQPLEFDPGTAFSYSNAGYSLLGAIIEQVTGASYETYLRERLFLPAGMQDTGYIQADWDDSRLAVGYRGDERWGTVLQRPIADDGPYWALRANGGIHSTTLDMRRWSRALTSGTLLSFKSMKTYWSPHVDEGFGDSHYAYGWVVMKGPDERRTITHNGGNGIFFADMTIFPDDDVSIILQTNVVADWPLAASMLETISLRLFENVPYPVLPDLIDIDPARISPLAARYVTVVDGEKMEFLVTAEGRELTVTPGSQMTFSVLHSTRTVDVARVTQLSKALDTIVAAAVAKGDLQPFVDAYRGEITLERMQDVWASRQKTWEDELGALTGYTILGTALRNGRDVTIARYLFEDGHKDSAYVWDPEKEQYLLGRSSRGLDPDLHYVPIGKLSFGSWDGGFSDSRLLRFADDGESLELEDATGKITTADRVEK